MVSASHLFATAHDRKYKPEGKWLCHWCGDPCSDLLRHDDVPPTAFSKFRSTAKQPAQHWMCKGCWLFRRPRCTVNFREGRYKDGQCPMHHSWLVTPDNVTALERVMPGESFLHGAELVGSLLQPPKAFCLMLLNGHGINNEIHRAVANVHDEIKADTVLHFTVDNVTHDYTVYDLEQALKGECHSGPGVRALLNLFGVSEKELPNLDLESAVSDEKRERGRPPKDNWEGTAGKTRRRITS